MKKFIFTPFWNIEKTEKLLSDYEKNGQRLTKISFPYIFEFKESSPKDAIYFLTVYSRSSNKNGMVAVYLEHHLTAEHGCNPVNKMEPITGFTAFRTLKDDDFTVFKGMRADFINKIYRACFLAYMFFSIMFSVLFYLSLHGNNKYDEFASFVIIIAFFVLMSAYSLFGYIKSKKKYNYYNKIHKSK